MGLRLQLSADRIAVAPGEQAPVQITVVNTGRSPVEADVRIVGGSVGPAQRVRIPAGETVTVTVEAGLPIGYPAGEHALAVEAAIVGGPEDGATTITDLTVAVGDTGRLSARLDPRHVGTRGRFRIAFQNSGDTPIRVDLSQVGSDRHVVVRFDEDTLEIPPGGQRSVRAKARMGRRAMGDENRRAFTVLAQHQSTPLYLTGVCSRAAAVRGGMMRMIAILAVLSVWAGTLVWGVGEIRSRVGDDVDSDRATMVEEELRRGGAGDEDGEGADGEGADGEEGDGETDDGAARGTRVGGTISGAQPDGVAVSLRPLDPEDPQSTTDGGVLVGLRGPMAKLAGLGASLPTLQTSESTSSREGGLWAFADVPGPGFYRVEFRKLGYETKVHVVEITEELEPVVLDTSLEAGPGLVRGTVTSDGTALGGVTVTVSDGLTTATTRTPQAGDGIGTFSFPGLSTPGTYTITVEHDGYGTEVRRVELGPSGSADLSIPLTDGVGSIRGVVTAAPFGSPPGTTGDGLEGVTVTVLSDDLERTTTSAGGGESLGGVEIATDGSFFLPQLPLGRSYTVTFSAPGHLTQSQVTALTEEHPNAELSATLRPAVGRVQGTVQAIPIWTEQNASDNPGTQNVVGEPTIGAVPRPVAGVGLTLSNETNTFKTVSTGGSPNININGIPPGSYVLTLELFNHTPARQLVEVVAGVVTPVTGDGSPVTLTYEPRGLPATASVSGQVTNLTTNRPMSAPFIIDVDGVTVTDDAGNIRIFLSAEGTFSLTGLAPGVRRLTFTDVASATDPTPAGQFEVVTVPVRLGEGQEIVGLRVLVRQLPDVGGIVVDNRNQTPVVDADVCLLAFDLATTPQLPGPDAADWSDCDYEARTQPDGTFEVEGMRPGRYFMRIFRAGYRPLTDSLDVAFGSTPTEVPYSLSRLPAIRLTAQQLTSGPFPTVETLTAGDLILSSTLAGPDEWLGVATAPMNISKLISDTPIDNIDWQDVSKLDPNILSGTSLQNRGAILAYLPRSGTYDITITDPDSDPAKVRSRTVSVFINVNQVRDVRVTLFDANDTTGRVFYDFPRFSGTGTSTSQRGVGGVGVRATGAVDIEPSDDLLPTTTTTRVQTTTGTLTGTTTTGTDLDATTIGEYILGPEKFVGGTASFTLQDNITTPVLSDFATVSAFVRDVPDVVDRKLVPLDDGTAQAALRAADPGELDAATWDAEHAGGTAVTATVAGTPPSVEVNRTGGGLPVGEYRVGLDDPNGRYTLAQRAQLTVLPGVQPANDPIELTRTVSILIEQTGGLFDPPTNSQEPTLAPTIYVATAAGCDGVGSPVTAPEVLDVDHDADTSTPDAREYTGLPSGDYCVKVTRTFTTRGRSPNTDELSDEWQIVTGLLQQQVGNTVNAAPYRTVLTPSFTPTADISGTVTADLATLDSITVSEAVAAMPVTAAAGLMVSDYDESTVTKGTPLGLVENGSSGLQPFGTAGGDFGAYQFPPLPVLAPLNDTGLPGTERTFTVAADTAAYNSDAGVTAYSSTTDSTATVAVPHGSVTAGDVTWTVPLEVKAATASLTVAAESDAGGALAATYTLSPVSAALVSSGSPTLSDIVLNDTPVTSAEKTDLAPLAYKLTVSAAHHSSVVRYVYVPPGESASIDVTLPAVRRFVIGRATWNDGAGASIAPVVEPVVEVVYADGQPVELPNGDDLAVTGDTAGNFSILLSGTAQTPAIPTGVPVKFVVSADNFDEFASPTFTFSETGALAPLAFTLTPSAHDVTVGVKHHATHSVNTATDAPAGVSVVASAGTGNPHLTASVSASTDDTSAAAFSLRPGNYTFTIAGAAVTEGADYLETTLSSTLRLDGTWTNDTSALSMTRNRTAWTRLRVDWNDANDPLTPTDIASVTETITTGEAPDTVETTNTLEVVKSTVDGKVRVDVLDLTPSTSTRVLTLVGSEFTSEEVTVGATSAGQPREQVSPVQDVTVEKVTGEVTLTICTGAAGAAKQPVADGNLTVKFTIGSGNDATTVTPVSVSKSDDGLDRTYALFHATYTIDVSHNVPGGESWTKNNVAVGSTPQSFVMNLSNNKGVGDCVSPPPGP